MSERRGRGQGRGPGDFPGPGGSRGHSNAGRGGYSRPNQGAGDFGSSAPRDAGRGGYSRPNQGSGDFGSGGPRERGRGGFQQSGPPHGQRSAGRGGFGDVGRGGFPRGRGGFPQPGEPQGHPEFGRGFAASDFPAMGTVPATGPSRSQAVSSAPLPTAVPSTSLSAQKEPTSVVEQVSSQVPVCETPAGPQATAGQKKKQRRSKVTDAGHASVTVELSTPGPSSVSPMEPERPPLSLSSDVPATGQQAHQRKKKRQKAIEASLETKFSEMSIKEVIQIPRRPDKGGTAGRPVRLFSNCFDISIKPQRIIMYQLEPRDLQALDKDGKKHRISATAREKRNYLKQLIPKLPPGSIYDGGFTVCCYQPIDGVTTERKESEAIVDDPDEDRKLAIKFFLFEVSVVETEDLTRYLEDPNASVLKIPQHAIRVLDCILKTAFKGQFEGLGRSSLFSKQRARAIEAKMMDIHRGFITSARPQWKLRINIDMTFTAFLSAGNLADVLYNKHGDRLYTLGKELLRDIDRIRVETNALYKERTGHHRKYTLHGVSPEPANQLKIENLNQTVSEYFADKYKIILQYPDLPCAKVNPKRDVFIPLELLNILPYQPSNASKADVAAEIVRLAAVRPKERFEEIRNFLVSALRSAPPVLKQFGVVIKDTPVAIEGRVLDVPRANFGRSTVPLRRGNWEVPSFHTPAGDKQPIQAIVFSVPPHRNGAQSRSVLLNGLGREAHKFGLNLQLVDGRDLQPRDLSAALKRAMQQGFRLAILVLHDDANYPEIKRLSDLELGIRTQCVRERTLVKPRVLPNLLLKINCKLSGINWTIPDLMDPSQTDERFIVFGADVTHPSPTQRDGMRMSVAAVTASYSMDLMRYAVVVRQQLTSKSGERTTREIIDNMEAIATDLLKCYARANNCLPTKVMFYRDGVSEGQFEIVVVEELHALQRACGNLRPDYQPAITYIVVQKRHRLRFMPETPDPRSKTGNVDPGTVIDRDVVHHRDFDFYLSSAEGIQGTCKPAYYHVLYDDSNWSSNALQAFTFYLCHAYQRCSRSVSYPAPTYYSHLAAARAREWLTGPIDMGRVLNTERNEFRVHESQVCGMFYM